MLLPDPPASLAYDRAEISAGSFAIGGSRLAVGTFSGWATFDLDTFECLRSEPHLLPEHCDVKGVQFDGDDLLLLGHRRSQSFERPADWLTGIWSVQRDGAALLVADVPAGNWCLVKRRSGAQLIMYDVSEGQGVLACSRSGARWTASIPHVRVAVPSPAGIVCLCEDRVVSLGLDGAITRQRALPRPERYRWTAAASSPGGLVLGGFDRETHGFAVALVPDDGGADVRVLEHPLEAVFSRDTITRAVEDDCCDTDIFHVGRVEVLDQSTIMLALGGGGEGLGACQGAGALGIVHLEPGATRWETQVLDEDEGICGLLRLPSGHVLVDFCGDIRRYGPLPP